MDKLNLIKTFADEINETRAKHMAKQVQNSKTYKSSKMAGSHKPAVYDYVVDVRYRSTYCISNIKN